MGTGSVDVWADMSAPVRGLVGFEEVLRKLNGLWGSREGLCVYMNTVEKREWMLADKHTLARCGSPFWRSCISGR